MRLTGTAQRLTIIVSDPEHWHPLSSPRAASPRMAFSPASWS